MSFFTTIEADLQKAVDWVKGTTGRRRGLLAGIHDGAGIGSSGNQEVVPWIGFDR